MKKLTTGNSKSINEDSVSTEINRVKNNNGNENEDINDASVFVINNKRITISHVVSIIIFTTTILAGIISGAFYIGSKYQIYVSNSKNFETSIQEKDKKIKKLEQKNEESRSEKLILTLKNKNLIKDINKKKEINIDLKVQISRISKILKEKDKKIDEVLTETDAIALREPSNDSILIGDYHKFSWRDNPKKISNRDYYIEFRDINDKRPIFPKQAEVGRIPSFIFTPSTLDKKPFSAGTYRWRVISVPSGQSVNSKRRRVSVERFFTYYPNLERKIAATKELVIGHTVTEGGKYQKKDLHTDNLVGFDIELADLLIYYLSKKIKSSVELIYQNSWWDDLLPKLQNQKLDIVISSMTRTKKREKNYQIHFSNGYIKTGQVAISLYSAKINSFEDMKGLTIGAQRNTTNALFAEFLSQKNNVIIKSSYLRYKDLDVALYKGEIDIAIVDLDYINFFGNGNRFKPISFTKKLTTEFNQNVLGYNNAMYSIVSHDLMFIKLINSWLKEDSHKIDALKEKYKVSTNTNKIL